MNNLMFSFNRLSGLWQHADFMNLWGAQTISQFGTQISFLAIPVTAAVVLHASPLQMGLLLAAETAPFLLFGLLAGVFVDRHRRKPILLWSDLGRGLLLAAVPVAWIAGILRLELLLVIAFLVGILNVFFEVSYQSYLPALVSRNQLVEANSKLETSRASSQVVGPGLAGGLIYLLGAPIAVGVDAATFLVSALFLRSIQTNEPAPEVHEQRQSIVRDIWEGIRIITDNPYLRPIAACTGTMNFFNGMLFAVLVLFATRELGVSAGLLGIVFAIGSLGFLGGAIVTTRIAQHIGLGGSIIAGVVLAAAGNLIVPMAGGPLIIAVTTLVLAIFLSGFGGVIYNINQVSLRQSITPDHLLGRMNASMRFMVWGVLPLGNLTGGLVASALGIRAALVVAGIGGLLAVIWPLFSRIRSLDSAPQIPAPAKAVSA